MPAVRTRLLGVALAAATIVATHGNGAWAIDELRIDDSRGTIDFAIGDSRIFRTVGNFKTWRGRIFVDEVNVPGSTVEVTISTGSIQMMDRQQAEMLKEADFFDTGKFPELTFRSTRIERINDSMLKVDGLITLRGITRPMTLDVTVSDRRRDAPPGARYARFIGKGTIKRSDFGMTKYIDMVGDDVEISIRTDAWR